MQAGAPVQLDRDLVGVDRPDQPCAELGLPDQRDHAVDADRHCHRRLQLVVLFIEADLRPLPETPGELPSDADGTRPVCSDETRGRAPIALPEELVAVAEREREDRARREREVAPDQRHLGAQAEVARPDMEGVRQRRSEGVLRGGSEDQWRSNPELDPLEEAERQEKLGVDAIGHDRLIVVALEDATGTIQGQPSDEGEVPRKFRAVHREAGSGGGGGEKDLRLDPSRPLRARGTDAQSSHQCE